MGTTIQPGGASPRSAGGTAVVRRTSPTFPVAALEPTITSASPPMSGRSYSDRALLTAPQVPMASAGSITTVPPIVSPALAVTGGGDLEDISCGPARYMYGG